MISDHPRTTAEEALLTFDHGSGRWSWDLSRIQAKGYTDNVVDLMIGKLTGDQSLSLSSKNLRISSIEASMILS